MTTIPDTEFAIHADTIVSAIGQDPDVGGLRDLLDVDGALVSIDGQHRTSLDGFFAGGDLVTMQRFVSVAFDFGKKAATEIDRYLRSGKAAGDSGDLPKVSIDVINTNYHPQAERAEQELLPAARRQVSFDEVELTLPVADALLESQRCFSCGNCTFCDNCLIYCPDMAINRIEAGYKVNDDFCKGCGLCVKECPTGSIVMRADTR